MIRGRETVLFSFSPKAYTQFAGFGWGSVLPLSPPCEVNLIQNLGVFLLIFLLFSFLEHKEEDKRGSAEAEDENAADSKRPCAVFTGHRSLKATRMHRWPKPRFTIITSGCLHAKTFQYNRKSLYQKAP